MKQIEPISIKDIEAIEKKFNLTLPCIYKQQILSLNGKTFAYAYISHPVLGELDFSRFISLSPKDKYSIYDIFNKVIKDKKYFPFADTDFGDYYCFDLTDEKVVFWSHETDSIHKICDSFSDFLNLINS